MFTKSENLANTAGKNKNRSGSAIVQVDEYTKLQYAHNFIQPYR